MIKRRSAIQLALYIVMGALIVVNIFPVLWMISCSFKDSKEILSSSVRLIPTQFSLDHYVQVFTEYDFGHWLINSVVTTAGITVMQVSTSLLAAFGLTYFRTKINGVLFYLLYFTMMVPFQVTMIPNYIITSNMGLVNTWLGVILPNVADATTFYFLYQHLRDVPYTYYEAAQIDGGDSIWTLTHVTLGLCGAALSAITILTVINSWNIYFWPLLVLSESKMRTLTVALNQFLDFEMGNNWGPFMATATLSCVPIIATYLCMQNKIMDAFVGSGIKG